MFSNIFDVDWYNIWKCNTAILIHLTNDPKKISEIVTQDLFDKEIIVLTIFTEYFNDFLFNMCIEKSLDE